ncbi:MAG: hypothetical protein MUC72_10565 [Acidobacteria bacterium]|jgi:hypothetical protein|nr:hypothetical protein [Acidobacteriota bacterium]
MRTAKAILLLAMSTLAFSQPKIPGPGPADAGAVSAPAGLWQRAVAIHQRNRTWYPEKITVLSEVLNRRGEPSSVTRLFFSLRLGADGRLNTELTRALKNGEDTTARMKEKVQIRDPRQGEDADGQDYYSVSISDSPFDPERQGAVSYSASGERHILFGRHCQRYDFTYQTAIVRSGEKEKLTWSGMAWLEEGSGVPVKLEFSLAPLPPRIRSLWTIYHYEKARPDRWLLTRVTISGHGGFLFIKKRFRTTTFLSNYRRPPEKEAAK